MRIQWEITDADVSAVQGFMLEHAGNALVKYRIKKNVEHRPAEVTPAEFWHAVVVCLLTTQQRSGPKSPVMKFLNSQSFPLGLDACRACDDMPAFAVQALKTAGGIRRAPTIAYELSRNLEWMEEQRWPQVDQLLRSLLNADDATAERAAARWIAHQFRGFGPKQSRNLLQMLGLTRYEIPLDSRVAKRLNQFGFPIRISGGALAGEDVYEFMLNGVQELCRRCDIFPCVFDAAMFASFDDNDGWAELAGIW
jgi:hypothetical protein